MFQTIMTAFLTTLFGTTAALAETKQNDWCQKLSQELRSVSLQKCQERKWVEAAKTPKNHPIEVLQWPEPSSTDKKEASAKNILVLGAIHGDEISAVSTVFRWLDFLERTKKDSFLRKNNYTFVPLVNPDGFYTNPRTRMNANGVDLNRNFSTKEWEEKALQFWKTRTNSDPRRFPGKKPATEIETQTIQKLIDDFKPDLIISVHAPYKLVDHDGPISFPNVNSPLPIRTLGAFPGSLGTYAGIERNIPVVTPELPSALQIPDLKALENLFIFIMKSEF